MNRRPLIDKSLKEYFDYLDELKIKKMEDKATYTRRHMSMSIEGALRNWGRKSMAGLLIDDSGREMTDKEVRTYLMECKAKGWKKIPCGDCEGFDHFEKGCPGHPITKEEYETEK